MLTICGNNCGSVKSACPQIICDNSSWPIYALSKNGQEFYPVVNAKSVIVDGCRTLDEVLRDPHIESAILDVNVNLYNEEPITLNIDDDGVCRINEAWLAALHKLIRLISIDPKLNQVIVDMDRWDSTPVLNQNNKFTYNTEGNIVAITYWRFLYKGFEYTINSSCNATVTKILDASEEVMATEVVREDIFGNKNLRINALGKAIIPLVTLTDSGLIRALDYERLLELIEILDSHDPINHTIIINNIKYQLTPYSNKFLWTNNLNWNEGHKWE